MCGEIIHFRQKVSGAAYWAGATLEFTDLKARVAGELFRKDLLASLLNSLRKQVYVDGIRVLDGVFE